MRGLGETLSANPVTGTASVSIPLATTPGRAGFGPELMLAYDSGNGNGPFGFGWQLSLPSISRKTDQGVPRYLDAEDSDTFLLSYEEELVPDVVETSVRTVAGSRYQVRRYRPRTEGSFHRIERWLNPDDPSDVFWRTITGGNVTNWYGRSPRSRVFDPEDPSRILEWLLCESHDDKGGVMVFGYSSEDSTGAGFDDGDAFHVSHELRRSDTARTAQRYLKRIRYGNRLAYYPVLEASGTWPQPPGATVADASEHWLFEVVFDHGDHDPDHPTPRPDGAWPVRPDPFSSYRGGFELRTYRTCRRVLMFHHFPDEEGVGPDCLVASTDLDYHAPVPGAPTHLLLASVTSTGYRRAGAGYSKLSLPPVEFGYSEAVIDDEIRTLTSDAAVNLPEGLAGGYWVDLHGDGLPGVLSERAGAWFYKPNRSPLADDRTASFGPLQRLGSRPSTALAQGAAFMDLASDGRTDLVEFDGPAPGFFEHDGATGWLPRRAFRSRLNRSVDDADLRLVDLTGDGWLDVLVLSGDSLTWYPSLGEEGFGEGSEVRLGDENSSPRVLFSEGTIHLADMSGDGLSDIVRIRNGDVSYWPNLGHGRFGHRVTMDNAPMFDDADQFDADGLRLADIDGSGTTDIIYLHRDGARIHFNESGNSLTPARVLAGVRPSALVRVDVVDLLGSGTAALVLSSLTEAQRPLRYVDLLAGGPPNLLVRMTNNLGAEKRIGYAPSTKFDLADREAGRPWRTRLPFPVQVVERVESVDHVSECRFVTRYAYHHGHYDGAEREFRGFGMVEQIDTESFEAFTAAAEHHDGQDGTPELFQQPVTVRTWFHTGQPGEIADAGADIAAEFCDGHRSLPAPVLPGNPRAAERAAMMRALKGSVMRREVFSFDGTSRQDHPYTTTEYAYEVRVVQPPHGTHAGVYLPLGTQTLNTTFERIPDDPRSSHDLVLEADQQGRPLQTAAVTHGRRLTDPSLPPEVQHDQARTHITLETRTYTADLDGPDHLRHGVTFESSSWELTGVGPVEGLHHPSELDISSAERIGYETVPDGATRQLRLIGRTRQLFLDNALQVLPAGHWDTLGLGHETYSLALTPDTLALYDGEVLAADLLAAGYVDLDLDGAWWIPSGTEPHHPAGASDHFFITVGSRDPFGIETRVELDGYDLLVEQTHMPLAAWNRTSFDNDYRLLVPWLTTDPNGNRVAVAHDELGRVVAQAMMGKEGSAEGDALADPTAVTEYDLWRWHERGEPIRITTRARESHRDPATRWQESVEHYDGQGRMVLEKTRVEPGPALALLPDGGVETVQADPRWVGTGRTVLNNKGNPVMSWEPYFSTTDDFETEPSLREGGVTRMLHYDPLGRNVLTEFPDGTLTRAEFGPWWSRVHDANDTVLESRWYSERGSPDPDGPEPMDDPERRAAWLAAAHAGTPGVVHHDSLGRGVCSVADAGGGVFRTVRSEADLTGGTTVAFDELGREVASLHRAIGGLAVVGATAVRGRRWHLQDVLGAHLRSWDEHGHEARTVHDDLRRPVGTLLGVAGDLRLTTAVVHGDRLPDGRERNLLGVPHQVYDPAGLLEIVANDFRGTPTQVSRTLALDHTAEPDWSVAMEQDTVAAIRLAAAPLLESEVFTTEHSTDALGRVVSTVLADGSILRPEYDQGGFLDRLQVQIRGQGPFVPCLKAQTRDAKGRRTRALFGNDVVISYDYDPESSRLVGVQSHPVADPGTVLQDVRQTYDPVGNITETIDLAEPASFFANAVVEARSMFTYDALYQLVRATGRESAGGVNDVIRSHRDLAAAALPHPNDRAAVRTYTEEYSYDPVGNLTQLAHRFRSQAGSGAGWTRRYQYGDAANILTATSASSDAEVGPYSLTYDHDEHGNMIRMPHLETISWDSRDQLRSADLGGGGTVHYCYGLDGGRVRKVIERQGNDRIEVISLGPLTLHRRRRRDDKTLRVEQWSLVVSDDSGHVLQVDTKTHDPGDLLPTVPLGSPTWRYRLRDVLGSCVVETDDLGRVLSREEFHPYGTSAYRSVRPGLDMSLKRYRFAGHESDDETGFQHVGARYYCPWLGRWTSADPAGFVDGTNLFRYARNNPVMFTDPTGLESRLVNFSKEPPEIAYSGTREQAVEHFSTQELIGQGTFRDDETGEETTAAVGIRLQVHDVQRAVQTGGEKVGQSFWQITDYRVVPGSVRIYDDSSSTDEPADGAGAGGEGGAGTSDVAPADDPGVAVEGSAPGQPEEPSLLDRIPQPNPGAAAVTTWDSVQRGRYTAGNQTRAAVSVQRVRQASSTGNAVGAWEEAKSASQARNQARTQTQSRLSPGGRAMSAAIDSRPDFAGKVAEYSQRAPGSKAPAPTRYAFTIAERVAEGSGRSNPWMSRLAKGGKVLGPAGLVLGVGLGVRNIVNAPEGERGRAAASEGGNFVGGAVGASLGMSAGVAAAGFLSGLLIGLGIISGPIGWLAIGLGILGGIAGAWAFGNLGRATAEAAYDY